MPKQHNASSSYPAPRLCGGYAPSDMNNLLNKS